LLQIDLLGFRAGFFALRSYPYNPALSCNGLENKGSEMAVKTVYQEACLDVALDEENGWLYADWKGQHHDGSIKEGINLMINLMVKHQVFKVLNDNTRMSGIWTGVAMWLVRDALPRARKAGLHSFAHVFRMSSFSRISAEAALLLLKPLTSNYFCLCTTCFGSA
jgi:hypothetical protein